MTSPSAVVPRRESTQDIRDRVEDRLDELMNPHAVRTKQWVHQEGVEHLVPVETTVVMPSLLEQLGQTMPGSTAGRGASSTKARPPASLEAADLLRTLTTEAKVMAAQMLALKLSAAIPGVQMAAHPRRLVDALVVIRTYVPDLDRDSVRFVDGTVRRWWAHARIVTTWDAPPLKPFVPCPDCAARGRLQVVQDPPAMVCLACGAAWDAATLDGLGAAYRTAVSAATGSDE